MSELPDSLRRQCVECSASVTWARTPRKSKGSPVDLLIDFHADHGEGGTVPVQLSGGVLYGDAVPRHTAEAMRKAGRLLHAQHKDTCLKRNATRKRS